MDITSNTRVVQLVPVKLVISKRKWEEIIEDNPFDYGDCRYEQTRRDKPNTSVVTLYIIKRYVRQAFEWIQNTFKKWRLKPLTKLGASRIICLIPKALSSRMMKHHELVLHNSLLVHKDSVDYYARKERKKFLSNFAKEDIPFIPVIQLLDTMVEKIRLKTTEEVDNWIT